MTDGKAYLMYQFGRFNMDMKIPAYVTEEEMLDMTPEELWEKYGISEEQYHYWHKKFQEM